MPERPRIDDRAVDMRLRREVDDRVATRGRLLDIRRDGDVSLVELVLDVLEVGTVARVGQLVEHDDLVALFREATCVMRADEAGAAGDEDPHRSKARHSRRPSRHCGSSGALFSERSTE